MAKNELSFITDDQSEALLFAALREVLNTGTGAVPPGINSHSINSMLARASREFLDAMAAQGLKHLGAEDDETGLDERTKRALRRALILEHDRILISNNLTAQGVDHLFFKGVLSDPLWWNGHGLRGATDIDILIPRSVEKEAISVLINLGYERNLTQSHLATEDASKERLFHHSDIRSHFPVDLHLGLLNEPPYIDPADQVFRQSVVYQTAVGPIRGPSSEDMLLLAAGNLGQSCFAERYKLALDAACLLLREKPDLNVVASKAVQWGVATPLWGLLRLIEERLHIPVPVRLYDRLAPFRPIRGVVERLAGVRKSPWHPKGGIPLILAGWPFSGRAFWPLSAARRWARLRIADRIRSRNI